MEDLELREMNRPICSSLAGNNHPQQIREKLDGNYWGG